MEKRKEYNWQDVEVTLCGVTIDVIPKIYYKSIEELELELMEAEANEDYERCIELRDFIKHRFKK